MMVSPKTNLITRIPVLPKSTKHFLILHFEMGCLIIILSLSTKNQFVALKCLCVSGEQLIWIVLF